MIFLHGLVTNMVYNRFAKTYDILMDKSLYPKWKSYVDRVACKQDKLLELACGTGELSVLLEHDYAVIASDISEDMLLLAQEKLTKSEIWQVDMCDLSAFNQIDIITCFADSICYLPDEEHVKCAFHQVYQTLTSDGKYLFDVHSIFQIVEGFAQYTYHHVDEHMVFVWESFEGEDPYSVEHELTCCQELENGTYERYDEIHYQRTYPLELYIQWLKQVGFQRIEVTADFGQSDITDQTTRWFFTCYK
ncbi:MULTISPECIES: class I SAM-dependent methyltransferase [unclassified Granulicatella]|uniref:class I SAM-dependent DNA methyltransferase n=1 Tax=unclassified Granulicatella TaxID=2630493 RepID=UPI0014301D90|nr:MULTISPECIES: class I SAM-dependent methyltransferase [unclassified Granulicatella]